MPVEMAIWRIAGDELWPLDVSRLDLEARLEDMLAREPSMIGIDLLIVGRQVRTAFGGDVDLLGLDAEGRVHVLELKRDRTSRDVVGQLLDYGSWAETLGPDAIERVFAEYRGDETTLDAAFFDQFGTALPEVVNTEQQLTIVASELDPTSERIVEFLAESYGVPINVIFFRHYTEEDREYLARTWLREPRPAEGAPTRRSKRRSWNGRDYYVILGGSSHEPVRFEIARKCGYLNAGGGAWHWKPLRNLKPGNRVFAYVGGAGYVGVAQVTGEMIPARDATVTVNGESGSLLERPEVSDDFRERALSDDPEKTEMVVPIEWAKVVQLDEAIPPTDLFWSQVTVCRLTHERRHQRTIETVENALGIGDDA